MSEKPIWSVGIYHAEGHHFVIQCDSEVNAKVIEILLGDAIEQSTEMDDLSVQVWPPGHR